MTRNRQTTKVITAMPPGGYWPDVLYQNYAQSELPCEVGFRIQDNVGRVWYLVETGESVSKGDLLQHNFNALDMNAADITAGNVGDNSVVLDPNATITEDQYAGGFLEFIDAGGEGYMYPIVSHGSGSDGDNVTFQIEGEIEVAPTASTVGAIHYGTFRDVQVSDAADPTVIVPIGVASYASTTSSPYTWMQTWGPCLVRMGSDDVDNIGDVLVPCEDTGGRVETNIAGENATVVGHAMDASSTDNQWVLAMLSLIP